MKKVGFYAGSFDPLTRGHLAIVCEALCLFDKLIIGVGTNPNKKTLFNTEEIILLIENTIKDFIQIYQYRQLNNEVFSIAEKKALQRLMSEPYCLEVVDYNDMSIDAAIRYGATDLVRGERIIGDHDAEMALAMANRELLAVRQCQLGMSSIPVPSQMLTYISSTAVKNLCAFGEYIAAKNYVLPSVHSALMEKYLKKRFFKLICKEETEELNLLWDDLVRAYSSNRFHHNLSHIGYCLNYANIYNSISKQKEKVFDESDMKHLELAIFYHDYVCEGKEDDEKKSFEILSSHLQKFNFDFNRRMLDNLIMATKHSNNDVKLGSKLCKVIHDVDLAILGDVNNYGEYAMNIRKEYHSYEDTLYAQGRSDVLWKFFLKDELFYLGFFAKMFSEQADANTKRERSYWENYTN